MASGTSVPSGLVTPAGQPAESRFNVYRNNVAVSLTEALEVTFPALISALGADFFKAMAGIYLRQHPPTSPMLMLYGDRMPDFLEQFEPVLKYPYLPDIARLELALCASYHSEDASSLDPAALQALPAEQLLESCLVVAPAVRLIRSRWPLHQLWQYNTETGAPKPAAVAEDVVVMRPEFDPLVRVLPAGGAVFLAALTDGHSFGDAVAAASEEHAEHDLTRTLGILFEGAALTRLTDGKL